MSDTSNINWGLAVAELANAVGASFRHNEVDGFTKWTNGTAPTEAEIDAEIARLQAEYDALQYQRDRASAYDSVGDQLDMLMKDMKDGTTTHQEACEAVKAKYPKP